MWRTILEGKIWSGEMKNRRITGDFYWVQATILPIRDSNGAVHQFLSIQTDITPHKNEAERYAIEKKFSQEVTEITKTGGWAFFPKTGKLFWTRETYLLHECDPEKIIDLSSALEFYLPEARPVIQWAVERGIHEGKEWDLELPMRTFKGRVFWARAIGKVEKRDGEVFRLYGSFQDISDQKAAMDALKSSEERLKLYLKHTPAAIAMFDRQMKYLAWSDRWIKDYRLGDQNLQGVSHYEVFPGLPERWKEDHQRVLRGEVYVNENDSFVRRDGRMDYIRYEHHPWRDGDGVIGGLLMFTEVITERRLAEIERKNLEQKLQQAQKLESLGVLAGGIAHDFNNLLTGVLGNAEFIREKVSESHEIMEPLSVIEEAAKRASELCRQMLAYAGKGQLEILPVDLNLLIQGTAKLLKHSVGKTIELGFDLEEDLPVIAADSTQLRQIVMNLVINASDAIGERNGRIVIETRKVFLTAEDFKRGVISKDPQEGSYLLLKVSDNGSGMSPETLTRIFEPFFTTKFTGRGLGLSAVMGIIRGHRGVLFVNTKEGEGTSFEVYFPCDQAFETTPTRDVYPVQWRGKGTVLLVEDELFVREIAARRIQTKGFDLLEAENGEVGMELYEKHRDRIVLVITDLTMPKMNGGQFLEKLRHCNPTIPCIMMSGYTQVDMHHYLEKYSNIYYLRKPADQTAFSEVLRSAYESVFK
jgi:PAS domain S-box-containing protein